MGGKIQFGVYELDREAGELRKHGVLIRLQDQPFQVLLALVERPGQVVTREEIRQLIWGQDTFVDFEQSLNKAVNRLREALSDDAAQPRYIETIPRRGYRFVAPVTGSGPAEFRQPTPVEAQISHTEKKGSAARDTWFWRIKWLVTAVALAGVGIAALVLFGNRKRSPFPEPRHITSSGFSPVLSRDGKLLAYGSTVDGVQHICIQQTAGGTSIPVTKGPDLDFAVDFSPDGTQIVFGSMRRGGGIYIAPTFPGEPKLVVSLPFHPLATGRVDPHFSPNGEKILWEDDSFAVTAPVDGGTPTTLGLNGDFRLDGPPRWSPSGKEIIFYGVRKREPEEPDRWWIVSLNGGESRLVRLPGITEDNEDYRTIRAWIRTKDDQDWIVYSISNRDAWKLFRVRISAAGQINEKPEQLATGTGGLCYGTSGSEDGKLAYCTVTSFSESIYEIPTNDRGQKQAPTLQLSLSGGGDERSPSVSRDGRWLAYDTTRPGKPNTILIRDLRNDADRFADDKDRRPGRDGEVSISPDGSKVIFERDCKIGKYAAAQGPLPCSFMVSGDGRQPEPVCEACTPRGFSSNGAVVLIQKYNRTGSEIHDSIAVLDLDTKTEKDFLNVPGKNFYHAYFSWDDHWVVFKQDLGFAKSKIWITPVRNGVAGKEAEWIAVTDGSYGDDKPQFSPDGNTLYFTSTRDGYLCIWAQTLDPKTKHPLGPPVAYEHFHNSMGRDAASVDLQRESDLTVARDKVLINFPELRTDIWMLQVE
jgi:Tol biopolymer transport system component/DNA-binding winged helix-turn-helix (wHTH) protein